jgi:hypothetical protein
MSTNVLTKTDLAEEQLLWLSRVSSAISGKINLAFSIFFFFIRGLLVPQWSDFKKRQMFVFLAEVVSSPYMMIFIVKVLQIRLLVNNGSL